MANGTSLSPNTGGTGWPAAETCAHRHGMGIKLREVSAVGAKRTSR